MAYFEHIDLKSIASHHPVARFANLWHRLAEEAQPVVWSRFSPMSVPALLPWTLLLEKQDDGRYFYRVCGSSCEQLFGLSYEGQFFGFGMPQDAVETRLKEFRRVEDTGEPLFSSSTVPIENREHLEVHRGVFGFSKGGDHIDQIIAVIAPI